MVFRFSFKRIVKNTVIAAAIAESAYIFAALIFLNGGGLQKLLNEKPDEFRIKYDYAYSLIPGRVNVQNFNMRIADSAIQLYFEIDKVTVGVDLWKLDKRVFHTHYVKAGELKFFLLLKKTPAQIAKIDTSVLPPIPGFTNIEKGPPPLPGPTNPWKLWLEGINVATLSDFWFDEFRFRGKLGISGGFYLVPGRSVKVEPSSLVFRDGMLEIGHELTLMHTKGQLDVAVKKFDADLIPEFTVLQKITANLALKSEVENLQFINFYLGKVSWLKLGKGKGTLEVALKAVDGQVKDGSFFKSETKELTAQLGNQNLKGNGQIDWTMQEAKQENRLHLGLSDYRITHKSNEQRTITGRGVGITAYAKNLDLSHPFEKVTLKVELPAAKISDLRYFNAYVPKQSKLEFTGGSGQIDAAFESFPSGQRDTGLLKLRTSGSRMKYRDSHFSGDLQLDANFNKSHFIKGLLKMDVAKIKISNAFARTGEKKNESPAWGAEISLENSQLDVSAEPEADVTISIKGDNARPLYTFLNAETNNGVPGWLPSVVPFNDLSFHSRIRIYEKELHAEQVLLEGKNSLLKGWFQRTEEGNLGRFLFVAEPIAAAMEFNGTKTRLRLQNAVAWYKDREREFPAPSDLQNGSPPQRAAASD